MPLRNYGVLKGRAVDRRLGEGQQPHYQVHLIDDRTDYRIAINVRSKVHPSELDFLVDDAFRHPILEGLLDLPFGFTALERRPGGLALDFIRGNLFDPRRMRRLPHDVPGPDNDLNEEIDRYCRRATRDEQAIVYAFGERWGPERDVKDRYFGFLPGNGIHDIHMNQGNVAQYREQDGVWQDGAVLLHFPTEQQWVAIFLKFGSQTWHTDDTTGHRIDTVAPTPGGVAPEPGTPPAGTPGEPEGPPVPAPVPEPTGIVRIVAALVNPTGPAPEAETVTLLNASPLPVDLAGWAIADRMKNRHQLSGELQAGAAVTVRLPSSVQLGNKGGLITLLDARGLKVDGVSYTKQQAEREGWTIIF
jgi:uncharacterized protein YukJ